MYRQKLIVNVRGRPIRNVCLSNAACSSLSLLFRSTGAFSLAQTAHSFRSSSLWLRIYASNKNGNRPTARIIIIPFIYSSYSSFSSALIFLTRNRTISNTQKVHRQLFGYAQHPTVQTATQINTLQNCTRQNTANFIRARLFFFYWHLRRAIF